MEKHRYGLPKSVSKYKSILAALTKKLISVHALVIQYLFPALIDVKMQLWTNENI